jgi:hypothetical protein
VAEANRNITHYLWEDSRSAPDPSTCHFLNLSLFLEGGYSLQSLRPGITLVIGRIVSNLFERVLVGRPYLSKREREVLFLGNFLLITLFLRFLDQLLDVVVRVCDINLQDSWQLTKARTNNVSIILIFVKKSFSTVSQYRLHVFSVRICIIHLLDDEVI